MSEDLFLRRAKADDGEFLFELRNEPLSRQMSKSAAPVPREEHERWLARALADLRGGVWLVLVGNKLAGTFRASEEGLVSVALAPAFRGRGLLAPVLRLGSAAAFRELGHRRLVAHVRADNLPSRKGFASAGFAKTRSFIENGFSYDEFTLSHPLPEKA